ncbi:MAG: hydrogenase maturation nickel metallochaperone HypA [Geodermatophilaceae bacterium]|nr:hydrogenase maturation nickel metallochaperone HypA [Geodermatophilaceae bacterium]
MHELSITQSVVDVVTRRTGTDRVAKVHLQIGKLSGIVPDSVRFCFELIAADTPLAGAVLEIDEPRGQGRCQTCGEEFELHDLILLCPCGSADVALVGGTELAVKSVEVL